MYVIHEEAFKEVLADIPPLRKELSEKPFREVPVLERCPVVHVTRRELSLYNLAPVVDDYMQLKSIEPSHCALALGSPAPHRLVHVHTLDVTRHKRGGINDGEVRTLAERAGLQKQQEMKPHLSLTLHKAVVREGMGKLFLHVPADIAQVEGLQVSEMTGMEQHEDSHHLTVGHTARTIAMPYARYI